MTTAFALALAILAAGPPRDTTLRVMSYNVHHCEGTDGKIDLPRIARVIREARPDLVALQEVDKGARRSGSVDQLAELAQLTGLHGAFARQVDFEGGEYGQAILSRYPIERLSIHWLPGEPERERRIAAEARVTIEGRPVAFVTTHLHHATPGFRERQATRLNELFAASDIPVILAGDLNSVPGSKPLAILSGPWLPAGPGASSKTYPAGNPDRKLDFIHALPRGGFRPVREEVIAEATASDHRPVVAELEMSAR